MTLHDRDRLIVQLVARFKQATPAHVREAVFDGTDSRTPVNRALKRLLDGRYLHRVERRAVGGRRGGSGQYVYSLGLEGYKLYVGTGFRPARDVNYHALGILDIYCLLHARARTGEFEIVGYVPEPDCHVVIGRYNLRPDLLVELAREGLRRRIWFEMDMATEGRSQIQAVYRRYYEAYGIADEAEWPRSQILMYVGVDAARVHELKWWLSQMPPEVANDRMFNIVGLPELSTVRL